MDPVLPFVMLRGAAALAFVLFIKRMGVPVPALPFLLLAGAQAMDDLPFAFKACAAATAAVMLADGAWFEAGRRYGRGMLGLMCRISISPASCIRRSETTFARRGAATVLVAKFIPGVSGLAPPLAGALGMAAGPFLLLNLAGTVLWIGSGLALGMVFHDQVDGAVRLLQDMGAAALPWLIAAFAGYILWLLAQRGLIHHRAARAPRLAPAVLAQMLARGDPVLLIDVRGAGTALGGRIPGAVQATIDSAGVHGLPQLPIGAELVTYCDCPQDVSAAHAALRLARQGAQVRVLQGGFAAWVAAGYPIESSPA
jgi:membrane protein DedA with SNARE-associated domain/rhodanese-related sulfurtransferase